MRAQALEIALQVGAIGVLRDRDRKKASGFKLAAELFGKPSEFDGERVWDLVQLDRAMDRLMGLRRSTL